ncbi:hypothetical protein MC45_00220 [Sphingomonas taxi]|jgi:hypothetical protein|uniref:3'-5' exonuclease n=1 Tax=Sphingomonas taxi TaxID=1549858 RepID=A0A097EC34_9SPHN|nr:hypothetical protein [Sphingomonas taxi]AIT05130.1 hypothetical protein MC45_00220 [Sphingomonas taxi]
MHHYTLTALAIATVDPIHLLGEGVDEHAVGLALFTCDVTNGRVDFALRCSVLDHGDHPGELGTWLDRHLPPTGVVAGYALDERILPALARLPAVAGSPVLATLAGTQLRIVINLRGVDDAGEMVSLVDACAAIGAPASCRNAHDCFIDWAWSRVSPVLHALQTDVIATMKLTLRQIAARTALGHEVEARLRPALELWLAASDLPAAQIHRSCAA